MGVPKFYRWVSERYPTLSQVVLDSQIPEFDNLYLDMNGIIHCCSHPNDDDVTFRISEEQIFQDIFSYIDMLFRIIRPKKVFFMAIDGVAPRAKMNQQRARRFMSARNAEEQLSAARKSGEDIPEGSRFDSNCITPGTSFMATLHRRLDEWVKHKVETDPLWRQEGHIRIILSGHNCPGEGEHKIMDFIRAERATEGYDANTRHCMYGLDADLMMLGLASHEPHFSLLREEVKFNRPVKAKPSKKGKQPEVKKRHDPSETKFHLLHLQLFREYLGWEFNELRTSLPFPFDLESLIDDWVLMGFLIGNDFIPHLPHVHIHEDALPLLYRTYMQVMPSLDGYLNEKGVLNLRRFEAFLKAFAENDKKCFMEKMEDEDYMKKKTGRPSASAADFEENRFEELVGFEDSDMSSSTESETEDTDDSNAAFVSSDEEADSPSSTSSAGGIQSAEAALAGLDIDDPVEDEFSENLKLMQFKEMDDAEFENDVGKCWSVPISNAFKRHKKKYYSEKMKFGNISKAELKAQAEGYIRAIQWNLHYYYHGCMSWNWFFPFHYAPYISDVVNFLDLDFNFEMSTPFKPFEQLLAVLPAASAESLPVPFRELMEDPNSPIADFYPLDFSTDLNGKKNDWEAVVLVPFINQQRLLDAAQSKESRLSNEETLRNSHGPHIMYTADLKRPEGQRAVRTEIDKDEFRIDPSKVIHGLLPGVRLDVHFPGFPTMCHLPHTAELRNVGVRVFHMASKKASMALTVGPRPEQMKNFKDLAKEMVDKQVYIDWPILTLARVGELWSEAYRYFLKDGELMIDELNMDEQEDFRKWDVECKEKLLNRYAIEVGQVKYLALCRRFKGCTYTVEDGCMRRVKQWSSLDTVAMTAVPLQLVVTNVNMEDNLSLTDLAITDAFPVDSKVFVMKTDWAGFGHPAVVQEVVNPGHAECRVVVKANLFAEPDVRRLRSSLPQISLYWFNNFEAGKRSGVDRHLLSRITGTVYLMNCSRKEYEECPAKQHQKVNIGLGLKLTKQNKEVPDYTRRVKQTGYWEFSLLCVQLITEYRNKFRDLFTYLERAHDVDDIYFADDVWPKAEKRTERLAALKEYLSEVPTESIEKIEGSSVYLDSQCIAHLERLLPKPDPKEMPTRKKCNVNPSVLYRPALSDGRVCPDPDSDFRLLDRVCYAFEGAAVPCGMQGTIIGIVNDKLDVLFDRPFRYGYKLRSSVDQCYRVPTSSVVNITFGKERKGKPFIPEPQSRTPAGADRTKNRTIGKQVYKQRQPTETTSGPYVEWKPRGKSVAMSQEASLPSSPSQEMKDKKPAVEQSMVLQLLKSAQEEVGSETMARRNKQHRYGRASVTGTTQGVERELNELLGIGAPSGSAETAVHAVPSKTEAKKQEESTVNDVLSLLMSDHSTDVNVPSPAEHVAKEALPAVLGALFHQAEEESKNAHVKEETKNESPTPTEEVVHRGNPQRGRGGFEWSGRGRGGAFPRGGPMGPSRGGPRNMRGGPVLMTRGMPPPARGFRGGMMFPRGGMVQQPQFMMMHPPNGPPPQQFSQRKPPSGNFFGQSRTSQPQQQAQRPLVNLTDLRPSAVTRPRKPRGRPVGHQPARVYSSRQENTGSPGDEEREKNVMSMLCPHQADTHAADDSLPSPRGASKNGVQKPRKSRLAANLQGI